MQSSGEEAGKVHVGTCNVRTESLASICPCGWGKLEGFQARVKMEYFRKINLKAGLELRQTGDRKVSSEVLGISQSPVSLRRW